MTSRTEAQTNAALDKLESGFNELIGLGLQARINDLAAANVEFRDVTVPAIVEEIKNNIKTVETLTTSLTDHVEPWLVRMPT